MMKTDALKAANGIVFLRTNIGLFFALFAAIAFYGCTVDVVGLEPVPPESILWQCQLNSILCATAPMGGAQCVAPGPQFSPRPVRCIGREMDPLLACQDICRSLPVFNRACVVEAVMRVEPPTACRLSSQSAFVSAITTESEEGDLIITLTSESRVSITEPGLEETITPEVTSGRIVLSSREPQDPKDPTRPVAFDRLKEVTVNFNAVTVNEILVEDTQITNENMADVIQDGPLIIIPAGAVTFDQSFRIGAQPGTSLFILNQDVFIRLPIDRHDKNRHDKDRHSEDAHDKDKNGKERRDKDNARVTVEGEFDLRFGPIFLNVSLDLKGEIEEQRDDR